jgi:predicted Zn finger-like uncharacterized protein
VECRRRRLDRDAGRCRASGRGIGADADTQDHEEIAADRGAEEREAMSAATPFALNNGATTRQAAPTSSATARATPKGGETEWSCPHCAGRLRVAAADLGRPVRCPHCGGAIQTTLTATLYERPAAEAPARTSAPPARSRREQLVDDAIAAEAIEQTREQRRAIRQTATAVAGALGCVAGGTAWTIAASSLPPPQGAVVGIVLALVAGLMIGAVVRGFAELLLPEFPRDHAPRRGCPPSPRRK